MTGVRQCKKGEGVSSQNVLAKRPPHPFFAVEDLRCPLPQGATGFTHLEKRLLFKRLAETPLLRRRKAAIRTKWLK
jgi:hypothetical protein